jgi:TRAP-type C4-dicarboxylate transport system permease large subunit
MFLAGVIPGLLAGLMLMVAIYIMAKVRNLPKGEWRGWGEVFASGREAGWGLFLIVIILGGIYGGIFTPTEAAAVAAVYAFFIASFVYRDMGPLATVEGQANVPLWKNPKAVVTAFFHPIHLGIIMVVNMEIGMITPPVGLNLFVTSGVAGMPMMRVVKAALPFLCVLFVFLIMVTYIPWLSTYLPNTFMGPEIIVK